MGTYLLDDRDRIGNSYLLISNAINASGPFPFPARLPCGLFLSLSIFACINVPSPYVLFLSLSSFSFLSGGEKRTRKESREPAWVGPPRPPVSGACFARKNILRGFSFRKAPQGKTESVCGGRPARLLPLIPLPVKVSFLWFFLFFSRKKRKNIKKQRKKRARPRQRWEKMRTGTMR